MIAVKRYWRPSGRQQLHVKFSLCAYGELQHFISMPLWTDGSKKLHSTSWRRSSTILANLHGAGGGLRLNAFLINAVLLAGDVFFWNDVFFMTIGFMVNIVFMMNIVFFVNNGVFIVDCNDYRRLVVVFSTEQTIESNRIIVAIQIFCQQLRLQG